MSAFGGFGSGFGSNNQQQQQQNTGFGGGGFGANNNTGGGKHYISFCLVCPWPIFARIDPGALDSSAAPHQRHTDVDICLSASFQALAPLDLAPTPAAVASSDQATQAAAALALAEVRLSFWIHKAFYLVRHSQSALGGFPASEFAS